MAKTVLNKTPKPSNVKKEIPKKTRAAPGPKQPAGHPTPGVKKVGAPAAEATKAIKSGPTKAPVKAKAKTPAKAAPKAPTPKTMPLKPASKGAPAAETKAAIKSAPKAAPKPAPKQAPVLPRTVTSSPSPQATREANKIPLMEQVRGMFKTSSPSATRPLV